MINNIPIEMIINTGASTDIVDEMACHKVTLQPSIKQLFACGSKSRLCVMYVTGRLNFGKSSASTMF